MEAIWLKSAVQYTLPLWTVAYIEQLILIRLRMKVKMLYYISQWLNDVKDRMNISNEL